MDDGARVFNESGKGYWMDGFGCLRAEGENRPSRPTHIVCAAFMGGQGAKARSIAYCDDGTTPTLKSAPSGGNTVPDVVICLNDQGGAVMYATEDVTATLRAHEHGHQPIICLNFQGSKSNNCCSEDGKSYALASMHGHDSHVICFEPGIAKREGDSNRFVDDRSVTLRANMGDNQPAICFQQNQRDEVRSLGEKSGAIMANPGMKNQNYLCIPNQVESQGKSCTP